MICYVVKVNGQKYFADIAFKIAIFHYMLLVNRYGFDKVTIEEVDYI